MTDHTREKLVAMIAALPPETTVGAEHVPYTLTREDWLAMLAAVSIRDEKKEQP